jgi:hypothetical protein
VVNQTFEQGLPSQSDEKLAPEIVKVVALLFSGMLDGETELTVPLAPGGRAANIR